MNTIKRAIEKDYYIRLYYEYHPNCKPKEKEQLYKIGMFANMNRVTVKTLRYYDEQKLLVPVYVDKENGYRYYAAGQMMSFLDHFGTWWMVHRPLPQMSGKQAVAISTAAGGGMKSTVRDMADSLEMWGIRKVYKLGLGVQAVKPDEIPNRIMQKINKALNG